MEILLKVLQGAYAYLLIFQVLVVSLLMLVLLWLIVRRTKEAHLTESSKLKMGAEAALKGSEAVIELEGKVKLLEEECERLKKVDDESQASQEKIKFLESKLLEYEILQEEIGTLSQLKLENEKLREKLVDIEAGITDVADGLGTLPNPAVPKAAEEGGNVVKTPTPPASAEGVSAAGLDQILQQIDELTKSVPPAK